MRPFTGIICHEGVETVDGRIIDKDAIVLPAETPLPLMPYAQGETPMRAVGRVDRVWRMGQELHAEGFTDLPAGKYPVAVDLRSMSYSAFNVVLHIHEAVITSVFLSTTPAWANTIITVKEVQP